MHAVCPECRGALTPGERETRCPQGHVYPVRDGLPLLLVPREGWDTSSVAAEFEAKYRGENEPWQYSRRGAEILKYKFIEELTSKLLGSLEGKHVVDLGCSVGALTATLGAKGADMFAFDISPTAVVRARARFAQATFAVASSTRLPLPLASVDLAIASDGLKSWQFTPEQCELCFEAVAAVLKPGAPALFLDHMTPRMFEAFVQRIDGKWLSVEDVFYLGDRLYYTIERVARDLRLPVTRLLASEGVAKALRGLSSLGARAGSKHLCVVTRAR